jgi:hypothetical protein
MSRLILPPGQKPPQLPPARSDRRPQYYDIAPGDRVQCYHCMKEDSVGDQYEQGKGFMADPANSPAGDGGVYTICHKHLPEDAVIYNNTDGTCRTKDGSSVWKEVN